MKKLEGVVRTYQHHNNRLGVIINVATETDFVARNEEFLKFVDELAIHIASEKPENMTLLLKQSYLLDPDKLVEDVIAEQKTKFKEEIFIRSFACVTLDIEKNNE